VTSRLRSGDQETGSFGDSGIVVTSELFQKFATGLVPSCLHPSVGEEINGQPTSGRRFLSGQFTGNRHHIIGLPRWSSDLEFHGREQSLHLFKRFHLFGHICPGFSARSHGKALPGLGKSDSGKLFQEPYPDRIILRGSSPIDEVTQTLASGEVSTFSDQGILIH